MYADTSAGRIKNLNDFTGLAKSSAQEAYHLFYSGHFKNILKPSEVRERLLYDGEADGTASWQKVEEYLRGCRQKKPVAVTLLADHASFEQVAGDRRESLKLHRDEWGYLSISIESDAPFLLPEKSQLTDEDFIGSTLEVPYYVKKLPCMPGRILEDFRLSCRSRRLRLKCAPRRTAQKPYRRSIWNYSADGCGLHSYILITG